MYFHASQVRPIEGEEVETSGHGGRLPPGINVGKLFKSFSGTYFIKPTVDFHRITYISIITNKKRISNISNSFQGFAPLQKPKRSMVLKGLDSSGTRKTESLED